MDVQALRWFQQVADGATVTEVSELEMVSQPGVSRALARLEDEVGAPLLQRAGRTLRMTHAGAAFKRHVDAVLHHLDDGLAAVAQAMDPETGTVTLAFQPSLGTWLVPDLVRSFRDAHPGVGFDLRTKADEHRQAVGPRSDVDLELSTLRPAVGGADWRPLADEPIRLLVPAGHRLAGADEVELGELRDEPFVVIRASSLLRSQTEELCRAAGFEPVVSFVADDLPTLRGYVAAGLGVALVPSLWETGTGPAAPPSQLRAVDLVGRASRQVVLAWSPERRLLPSAELFREHVLDRARAGLLPRPQR